ncbi:MAG: ribonuclease HI [Legionellales bacterium]|nr:ribonuclease HI [Legionellales bacterium]
MASTFKIYTDGACLGNPGPGGWGVLIVNSGEKKELSGREEITTNNRMELTAAIEGLKQIPIGSTVVLVTDSEYVKNGITSWIYNWKQNGWRTAGRKSVKNQDLWEALDELSAKYSISWEWVKGHSGHPENEFVDQLARKAINEL